MTPIEKDAALREMFERAPFTRPSAVPGGYPAALFEPVDVDAIGEFLKAGALSLYHLQGGSLPTTAYVFGRRSPWVAEPFEGDTLLVSQLKSGYGDGGHHIRDAFAALIAGAALVTRARAVAILMEAWVLVRPADGSPLPTGSIEHVPGRREMLMVSLETSTDRAAWMSEIKRDGGAVTLEPFDRLPAGTEFEGRFFGLMP